ncbi:imidazole glycerol phosphate synthase subunit HisH [Sphingomonas cavernae]|uniref:Imidazole glycerol phosphate synthase subunit HisH n=1 Tax=Sphingomonas cavernae TaxID=2320861 RepID=A0A418WQI5_9SPHN|nr:imidazole glycerol phosphate synthase subunit HisH [Sphingomonas cavernae]RJF93520.1 imidazole glycerol phosphate synthase subunit HisH [Sphingomonas cavernae]
MADRVALIDYGAGNLHSVHNALRAAGASDVSVTADPEAVLAADRIVLPGVGAFAACASALNAIPGMRTALDEAMLKRARPFLGICVGMQLMATRGDEFGGETGLDWIPGTVRLLRPADPALKVPHMGWNDVTPATPHPLITAGEAYYLHSFVFDAVEASQVVAVSDHGGPVTAAVARDAMIGVQFHPEKSQRYGLDFLARFLEWRP